MSGDLLEVVILVGIFLLSTLFGSKKKGKGAPGRQVQPNARARPAAAPRSPTVRRPATSSSRDAEAPSKVEDRVTAESAGRQLLEPESMLQDFVELLREQQEGERRPVRAAPPRPEPELEDVHAYVPRELPRIVSLETLEPAGGTSHERFHDAYMSELPPVAPRQSRPHPLARRVGPQGLRRAIVWSEILGPPKGLSR